MAFDLARSGFGDRAEMSNLDKIKMIPLDDIAKNDQNFYSMSGIDELAESIEMVGLLNPVSVISDGSKYRLVSGHRRCAAYYILRDNADPSSDAEKKYSKIPAIVLRDMDDQKETFALITANSTARELTYSEKLQQEKLLRETLTAMKAAGMAVPRNLGQYIADQIGVSRNEVSRMHSVNENLIPEAREKVDAGEMTAQQAYEMSRKTEEEQQSSFAESLSKKYQEESATRRKNLSEHIEMFCRRLARYAVFDPCSERFESIASLRKQANNMGGGNSDFQYMYSGKGLSISSNGYTNDRLYSWTEVWDALAMYAINALASNDYPDDDAPESEQVETGWHTGTPTESGEYVAVFDTPGSRLKRLCYFDSAIKRWTFTKWGTLIDSTCVMWLRLPDESCTDSNK